jgi:hypothetical protein
MKTKIIAILSLITISTSFVGCKKYLDVNKNPNIASDVDIKLVLPTTQVAIGSVMGTQFQINGSFWSQHWTQSPLANQYKIYDQYQVSSDNYNRPWNSMYSNVLTELKYVYNKASTEKKKQYMAVARLMQAYTFHVLTDAFGDIPFTEATRGSAADGAIVNPKYDKQEVVYDGIIAYIDEAQALIDVNDLAHPGNDDLIYKGDMQKWLEFSNTLKLKVALRLSEINPVKGKALVSALVAPDYLSSTAQITYSTTGGSQNPLYSEMIGLSGTTNIFASKTTVDYLNGYGDPRTGVFYTPIGNGTVVGLAQGDWQISSNATGKSFGGVGVGANPQVEASATAPVILLSVSESEFLQAEAIARGWITGDDKEHYTNGILAGMDQYAAGIAGEIESEHLDLTAYGNANADLTDYLDSMIALAPELAYPTAEADKIKTIITQKWASMAGNQGFEAWTEWRRTGHPAVIVPTTTSLIGAGKLPQRFIYPTDEVNLNKNFPGQKLITEKVWWDVN